MICTIKGLFCKSENVTNKSTGEKTPRIYLFSGDETVCISGAVIDNEYIGQTFRVDVEMKDREYEGRSYRTIKAMEGGVHIE